MATLRSDALSTVEMVEEALQLASLSAMQTDAIIRMINGVTGGMERFANRKLKARAYTPETTPEDSILSGEGLEYLYLPQWPANSISKLEIGLSEVRQIVRRDISAVTANSLESGGGFSFNVQDATLNRVINSICPTDSTQLTTATITSVVGGIAQFTGGWSNGTPDPTSQWWFASGFYVDDDKLILSSGTFSEGTKNIRLTGNFGYAEGSAGLDHLQGLCTAIVSFIFNEAPKVGLNSETIDYYSYSLDGKLADHWAVQELAMYRKTEFF